jgi:hypothetical protein
VTCPHCNGPVRTAGEPHGYYGAGAGGLLYAYLQFLHADRRYVIGTERTWLCDGCRVAGMLPLRGDPASDGAGRATGN